MADIYTNSFLTLAATSSVDHNGGLFFRQSAEFSSHKIDVTSHEGRSDSIYIRRCLPHIPSLSPSYMFTGEYPLLTRAWTFQELFLSRRILHFSRDELMWECTQHACCQCSASKPLIPAQIIASEQYQLRDQWHEIVVEFSKRALSFEKDKLPALSGVVKASPQWKQGQRYLAGLWESSLLYDLLWERFATSEKCPIWRAPSWTWATINGGIRFCRPSDYRQHTQVIFFTCTPSGLDLPGRSVLVLLFSGPLIKVTLSPGHGYTDLFKLQIMSTSVHITDYELNEGGDRWV